MQNRENNTGATGQTSSSDKKCEKCGGSGLYIFMQLASEYAKSQGKPHIYGDKDYMVPVGRKCPYCNGGFTDDVIKARKSADIPSAFYNKQLKDFDWNIYVKEDGSIEDTTNQKRIVELYIEQFRKWEEKNMSFYIYSRTKGAGKTLLASCICNELMERYAIKTRFVNASELIDISTSGDKSAPDEYRRNPMKLLYECKFLVIDDLGQKNTVSEWMEDVLYKLLNYRIENNRMTMITSNVPIQNLPLNERITDRIDKLCMPFHLPEICVRSKETREARQMLLKDLGWDLKETQNSTQ